MAITYTHENDDTIAGGSLAIALVGDGIPTQAETEIVTALQALGWATNLQVEADRDWSWWEDTAGDDYLTDLIATPPGAIVNQLGTTDLITWETESYDGTIDYRSPYHPDSPLLTLPNSIIVQQPGRPDTKRWTLHETQYGITANKTRPRVDRIQQEYIRDDEINWNHEAARQQIGLTDEGWVDDNVGTLTTTGIVRYADFLAEVIGAP
jgi:hypothetical protein